MSLDPSIFLDSNAAWAKSVSAVDPNFFPELAKSQAPPLLWIGCADSRVPESVVTAMKPGKIFTHRNIANQYQIDDANAGAVVEYGVLHLNITNVVVVGHTNCGGCTAAHNAALAAANSTESDNDEDNDNDKDGRHHRYHEIHHHKHGHGHEDGNDDAKPTSPLDTFLGPLIDLQKEIGLNTTIDDLIVANVKRSVDNLANSDAIKQAWEAGRNVSIHGWLYNLSDGLLSDLHMTHYLDENNFA